MLYLPAREAVIRGSRSISDEELRKRVDKELTRSGLVVNDPQVLEAMEETGEDGEGNVIGSLQKKGELIHGHKLKTAGLS